MKPMSCLHRAAIACLSAVLLGACGAEATPGDDVTQTGVAPASFAEVIALPETFVLNVHTPDEGSIPGTEANIPFDQVRTRVDDLPADKSTRIAVYCRSDRMSTLATVTLGDLGYANVTELRGGMEAWQDDGRPLQPPVN